MDYRDCLQLVQKYLENNPVIILGSGASADYKIPLMSDLSKRIKHSGDKFDDVEFTTLCNNIDSFNNLEVAIDKTALSDLSINTLRKIIWDSINKKDLELYKKLLQNVSGFALIGLLKKVITNSQNTATIVTTNYDRLVEYAVDMIDATAVTGFDGNVFQKLNVPSETKRRGSIIIRERVVNIWKVHGSLDWFSKDGRIVGLPLSSRIPINHIPLIIPPSKGKYSNAHDEPYRSIISQADIAFSQAGSFLCIGYGFNDDHIQPKLFERIKKGIPIVVLCRDATDACKQNVASDDVNKYIIIDRLAEGKTRVICKGSEDVFDGNFWKLPEFNKNFLGVTT